jgi:hypothetical protein
MREDFAVFILSHGRANSVKTVSLLNRCNYTGKWYIILDDEDTDINNYINNFGKEHIVVFDKKRAGETFDIMDNFDGRGVPTFARNVLHTIARDLNLNYFLEFEDDYTELKSRYLRDDGVFSSIWVGDFDAICNEYINFLENTNSLTVAFCQQGDFIGGMGSAIWKAQLSRKAMNSFFCKVSKPFQFFGRFNDDVNMYIQYGKIGELVFTTRDIMLHQLVTQANEGGITEAYLKYGTYVKSFYSVMLHPNCIKISTLGVSHHRYHHQIDWESAVPKIISDKFKK